MELDASTVVCPSCGQSTPASARFCPECAQDLSGLAYMGFWIRFAAYLIDGIILFVVNVLLALTLGTLGTILSILVGIVYFVGFWSAEGATPGKMAVGIQIATVDGEPIDVGRALLRYVGYWVSGITLGIGFLMIAFTREKRGLHDLIASTVVVKKR